MRTVLFLAVALSVGAAQDRPPTPYIDKGVCPFEGCTYRSWTARKEVPLLDRPNGHHVIGRVHSGEVVLGITGEVHSIPVRVVATQDHNPDDGTYPAIKKGKVFYLLHPCGEGVWAVWFNGRPGCIQSLWEDSASPQMTWWVQVKTKDGLVGWAVSDRNFDGQDRYG